MAAPAQLDRSTVSALQLKAYRHHAQAIDELRMSLTHMSEGDPREKLNITLRTFWIALSELHVSRDPSWRPHFYVLTNVINELGGIKHLWDARMLTTQDVSVYTITLIVSNTTSPARQEVASAAHLAMLSWYIDQYETWEYAPFPCPGPLFALIVRINYLRTRRRDGSLLSGEARPILEDIASFSPDEWTIATKKDHRSTWLMIAKVYRSAVLLYALGALDIVTPGTSRLVNQDKGSDRVARFLTELMLVISNASHSTLVHYGLVWPTLIAGVYATSIEERDIIQTELAAISRACGMVSPLVAKKVLEDFWSSGEHGWEACFKAPFSFLA
ncbi:hypothetical protein TI39_contig264g00024 [Zymoseptoria brevis]|uniref:Uncharacterized protein n=1 Tax=Zymoseptoria brevis TaxID=1047168 RepID=A0A0F4GXQ4_9PEZI|nr:hypothetical protein TI39_contig264g00024 [Zymoseptoria brevis]